MLKAWKEQAEKMKKAEEVEEAFKEKRKEVKIKKGLSREAAAEFFEPVTQKLEEIPKEIAAAVPKPDLISFTTPQASILDQPVPPLQPLPPPAEFADPAPIIEEPDDDLPELEGEKIVELIDEDALLVSKKYPNLEGKEYIRRAKGLNIEVGKLEKAGLISSEEAKEIKAKNKAEYQAEQIKLTGKGFGFTTEGAPCVCDPEKLADRLELIVGSLNAGKNNEELINEGIMILDELLNMGEITKEIHEELYRMYFTPMGQNHSQ